jgi:pimeloyl-ACP methyl ester carboxylesterase
MSCLVGDVVALIERYGAPVHLVGHDWGAAVAWATAEARPDLVQTLTTASVPHPVAFTRSLLTSSQALRSWYVLAFQPPALPELLTRSAPALVRGLLRSSGLTQDEVSRVWVEMIDDGALPGALGWYRALPLSVGRKVGPIRVPTTHVWSDGDRALDRSGADATGSYVHAAYQLRVLHGVSHWIPLHAPDAMAEIILHRIAGPQT